MSDPTIEKIDKFLKDCHDGKYPLSKADLKSLEESRKRLFEQIEQFKTGERSFAA